MASDALPVIDNKAVIHVRIFGKVHYNKENDLKAGVVFLNNEIPGMTESGK
jgi:hypothetical protein